MRVQGLKILLIVILTLFQLNVLKAQSELFDGKKHRICLSLGHGFKDNITSHADYYYRVYFFTLQYQYNIYRKGTFGIDFLSEAQYNLTDYAYDIVWEPAKKQGMEFGIHPGLIFRKNFWDNELSIYGALVIGPHYITGSLNRQASGFVFSDNLIFGVNIRLSKRLYMDVNAGFRHLSSADLTSPNDGINNIFVNGGIIYLINSKS
jgi:hypothetical protein